MPKNPPQKPTTKDKASEVVKSSQKAFEKERGKFKSLLLANPNFFGNLKESQFKAEVTIQSNSFYEEIGCVGYQPQANRLEAVVFIKRPTGYGGDICSPGTPEYVRFYISFDNGATWDDLGLRSFTAFDIPGTSEEKRLEYAVTMPVQLRRKFCFLRNQAKVRAILSWNSPPPPNDPGFNPVFGEVHNTNIQIEPLKFFKFFDLISALELKHATFSAAVDMDQTISAAQTKALNAVELKDLYKGKNVEPHRFAFNEVQNLLSKSSAGESTLVSGIAKLLPDLGIDLTKLAEKFFPSDGNTNFEELECIGYSPDENLLAGVIRLKLPNGFSGGPCTAGSKEFVTFWADTDDNGTFETCLGTTSVNVYDSDPLPEGGLEYAVFLPVDLDQYRKPCKEGARLMKIRAILSWQQQPPCSNPNYVPVWGNREETIIQLKPGKRIDPGDKVPLLTAVGDIIVSKIDNAGLAQDAVAIHTGVAYDDAPFGGRITLAGKIVNGNSSSKYRIMRKPNGAPDSAYVPLTNEPTGIVITINTWDPVNGLVQTSPTIHADANGYYNYEDYASNHFVESNILSVWFSNAAEDNHQFDLRLDLKVDANPANDIHSNVVTVLVDNTGPKADLKILLASAVECAEFFVGQDINGSFIATDDHFSGFSFVIRPLGPSHNVKPIPPAGSRGFIAAPGLSFIADPGIASGAWVLHTANMGPCGYSLTIVVSDRTNVNSGQGSFSSEASVGFCLRKPGT